jgi:hypothetical protein
MRCPRPWQVFLALGAVPFVAGCLFTSKTSFNEAQAQSRILSQQNSAQLAEIENLKSHNNDLERKLILSEEQTALLKEQVDLDRRQMANYEREYNEFYEQFRALTRDQALKAADTSAAQKGDANSRPIR